jgi:hypothetical protein
MSQEQNENKMKLEYAARIEALIGDADPIKYDILDFLFRGLPDVALIGVFLIMYLIVQTIGITTDYKVYVQLLISSAAVIISATAYYGVFFRKWDKAFSEYKAGKICRSLKYDKGTKVLLTALIFMKLKEPKIELLTIYSLEPDIFEKKTLIQSLYD